jgi:hypothetical protein
VEDVTPNPPRPPSSLGLDPRTVAVLATMAVFLAFLVAGVMVQPLNVAFGIWFTEVFVFLALGWFVLRATGRNPVRYTGLGLPALAPAVFGFLVGAVNFFAVVAPIQYVSQLLMPKAWRELYNMAGIFQGQSQVELALIVLAVSVAAPVCEEFFFRGILLQGLKIPRLTQEDASRRAILVSAIIFSAFHLDPVGFVARVELGVVFGWLFLRTGSLWPGILAHAANNLVSTVLFFAARQVESPREPSTQEQLLGLLTFVVLGSGALMGLLFAAQRNPNLLGGPERPKEAPEGPVYLEPVAKLLHLATPWLFAAALTLGGYVALDPRGIQLSQYDRHYPLAPVPEDAPDALHAEREALYELRIKARRGEIPIEEYVQERARQSKQKKRPAL